MFDFLGRTSTVVGNKDDGDVLEREVTEELFRYSRTIHDTKRHELYIAISVFHRNVKAEVQTGFFLRVKSSKRSLSRPGSRYVYT